MVYYIICKEGCEMMGLFVLLGALGFLGLLIGIFFLRVGLTILLISAIIMLVLYWFVFDDMRG